MSDSREAGSVMLSQLDIFNETVKLFENDIDPEIRAAIADVFIAAAENNWIGGYEDAVPELWLALSSWDAAEPDGKLDLIASLDLVDVSEDSSNYFLAALCGLSGAEAGLKFFISHGHVGGGSIWRKYVQSWKEKTPKAVLALEELGFKDLTGKGEFFLPVIINTDALANAYRNNEYDEALQPLNNALEIVKQSLKHFDAIIKNVS
jgi:hypothetical protein